MYRYELCPCCQRDMIRSDDLFAQSTTHRCTLPTCRQELVETSKIRTWRTIPIEEIEA